MYVFDRVLIKRIMNTNIAFVFQISKSWGQRGIFSPIFQKDPGILVGLPPTSHLLKHLCTPLSHLHLSPQRGVYHGKGSILKICPTKGGVDVISVRIIATVFNLCKCLLKKDLPLSKVSRLQAFAIYTVKTLSTNSHPSPGSSST